MNASQVLNASTY